MFLMRRKARRALRRQKTGVVRRAVQAQDGERFANAGRSAPCRSPARPHYPGEPRALVGSDVLALIQGAKRQWRAARWCDESSPSQTRGASQHRARMRLSCSRWSQSWKRVLDQLERELE